MKALAALVAVVCVVCVTSQFTRAQEASPTAVYTLRLRVVENGKESFTQSIRLKASDRFDIATHVGESGWTCVGTGVMERNQMHLNFEFQVGHSMTVPNGSTTRVTIDHSDVLLPVDGTYLRIGAHKLADNGATMQRDVFVSVHQSIL